LVCILDDQQKKYKKKKKKKKKRESEERMKIGGCANLPLTRRGTIPGSLSPVPGELELLSFARTDRGVSESGIWIHIQTKIG